MASQRVIYDSDDEESNDDKLDNVALPMEDMSNSNQHALQPLKAELLGEYQLTPDQHTRRATHRA